MVLGAGFGGLEVAATLSEECGDGIDVTLIDSNDAFAFGFSKLDVLFGHTSLDAVRMPYRDIAKPGVRFVQERVTAIDPESRRVTTDAGVHDADHLVIALGAEYDYDATPGLRDAGNEFYSFTGAQRLAGLLEQFDGGDTVIGVCGAPYKCTPAPSEAALLLHDHLTARGVRARSTITFVLPMAVPVPPSPDASRALVDAFAERDIRFMPGRRVAALDGGRHVAVLDDGSELRFDLFLGVPKHRVPAVVAGAGLAEDGYVAVDRATLATRFANVYAIGDVTSSGVPKAGTFAEGQGRAVAASIVAALRGGPPAPPYTGKGACYVEFGDGRVGRIDVELLGGDQPGTRGTMRQPSVELRAEKSDFGTSRRARWFGN